MDPPVEALNAMPTALSHHPTLACKGDGARPQHGAQVTGSRKPISSRRSTASWIGREDGP